MSSSRAPCGPVLCLVSLVALVALVGAPPDARAHELVSERELLGDLPTVLTATRLRQPSLESPSAITVITRRMIRASGARDVAELLRLAPGFQVEYFDRAKPIVTYHGTADDFARRLQVLVDGRSVYTPIFGGVLWNSLPLVLEDIERIEVIRSPNAASYGPNSYSAIINIITAHPATESAGTASVTVGQDGQRDGFARATGRLGAGDYRLSLEHQEDDGYDSNVHPDYRDLDRLSGRFDLGDEDGDLLIKGGLQATGVGKGRRGDRPEDGDTDIVREREIRTAYSQVRWTRKTSDSGSLSIQYYANYDRWIDDTRFGPQNDFALAGFDDPRVRVDLNVRSVRHDVEAVYRARVSDRLRVVGGAGARYETVESRWLFGDDEERSNSLRRVFGHAEYRVRPDTTLHVGALVEDNDLVDTTTSPRVALVQRTAPYQRLRISTSYATRTPVLFEERQERFFTVRSDNNPPLRVYTDYTEQRDLEPERMHAIALGYRIEPPGRHWGMDVKLFRERLDDVVVEVETGIPPDAPAPSTSLKPVTGFVNGLSGDIEGIEGELTLYPGRDLDLRFWGSRASLEDVVAVNDDIRAEYIASVPHTTFGLSADYRLSPTRTLTADYYYIDRMSWVDKSDTTSTDRLDFQYLEEWPRLAPSAFVALRLDNVLGEYREYDVDNVVDTRLSVRAGLRF